MMSHVSTGLYAPARDVVQNKSMYVLKAQKKGHREDGDREDCHSNRKSSLDVKS